MKFFKGILLGTVITAGVMMYAESNMINNKKMTKKAKKLIKTMGL